MLLSKTKNQTGFLCSFLAVIVMFGLIFSNLPLAKADNEARFGIQPANIQTGKAGYFVLQGQLGEVLQDTVAVLNTGSTPITLIVYPVDASTSQQSGATYDNFGQPRKNVGAWINIEKSEVEIAPHQQMNIGFSVTVPKDAPNGQHLGGIAVQPKVNDTTTSQSGPFGAKVVTRAVTPLKINVGGAPEILSLKINKAEISIMDKQPALTLSLLNDGTGFIKPKGDVSLIDASGKTVMATKITLDNILTGDTIVYPVSEKLPDPGTYKVHVSLEFGGTAPAVYDGQVEVKAPANVTANPIGQASASQSQAAARTAPVATTAAASSIANPIATPAPVPTSDNTSMLIGILIGVALLLGLTTLGLGGYIVLGRGRKGN